MPEPYRHLKLARLQPVTQRRAGGGRPRVPQREPVEHATRIDAELDAAIALPAPAAAFDPRLLLKLDVRGIQPGDLEQIEGFEVVSHERTSLVALFASDAALREFKRRLALVKTGQKVTRPDILYAIENIGLWSADDRRGPALRTEGLPVEERVIVDVELWPLERPHEREQLCSAFETRTASKNIEVLDKIARSSLIMYRVRVEAALVEGELLRHRDVRTVDLPPRYSLETTILELAAEQVGAVAAPAEDAPGIVVLDSGIVSNHPLLESAVGDAQSFLPDHDASDEHGHGTAVAGLALYGDVGACAESNTFVPQLRIFSGRVLDANGRNRTGFLENQIAEAVDYFIEHYQARVFNLSVGDDRKPFTGGHVRGLAVTLDDLARTKGVLFVVAAGNYRGEEDPPRWRAEYPRYLLDRDAARLLDPAPALNVLTVGGLAKYEASRQAQRYENDPAHQRVARRDQPSPFTRTGAGPGQAIKPELVEYAGNYAVDLRGGGETIAITGLLGEVTLNHAFVGGNLLVDRSGTSFAAPKVAHVAAKLLSEYPDASANLLRALLVASAEVPSPARELMLVSPRSPVQKLFKDLRMVVIDEVHALAGTDRGAHLMSVIERVAPSSKNDIQRVGLCATVGNPLQILAWLKGSSQREGVVVDPPKTPSQARPLRRAPRQRRQPRGRGGHARVREEEPLLLSVEIAHGDRCRENAWSVHRRVRAPQLCLARRAKGGRGAFRTRHERLHRVHVYARVGDRRRREISPRVVDERLIRRRPSSLVSLGSSSSSSS